MRRGAARICNFIDRAVWHSSYIHVEHDKLMYNQVITTTTSA